MQLAFYAPLKSPNHVTPSGDRTMARLLISALEFGGHQVDVISEFRSFLKTPDKKLFFVTQSAAQTERSRVEEKWRHQKPDAVICYHPYYKAPDFIAAPLCAQFSVPYIAIEASIPSRKNQQLWHLQHDYALHSIRQASRHVCFTKRDKDGLQNYCDAQKIKILPPFLNAQNFPHAQFVTYQRGQPIKLICAGMMRSGAKLCSYQFLAKSLALVKTPWHLTIVGDGDCRADVEQAFAIFNNTQIKFTGGLSHHDVLDALNAAHVYVWPGFDEAYGMAYFEAASMGLPCVALDIAGVGAVVEDGRTGVCVRPQSHQAFASAVENMANFSNERLAMARAAYAMARTERTLKNAAQILDDVLYELSQKTHETKQQEAML